MGAAVTPHLVARLILWLAIVAPWLSLLPVTSPVIAIALAVLTLVGAFHGVGLLVARLARRDDLPAALLVHWGLAAMLGIAGALMMVRAYGSTAQTILVVAGAALHSGLLILDRDRRRELISAALRARETRFWIVPGLLLVAVAALHVLGAAGDLGARPFDDDGHHLAQLQRLLDTGTLADPIGFARSSQLGGQVVAGAFARVLGDVQLVRVIDGGLGFGLLVWLALTRLRPRDATTGVWAVLLIFVAASYPFVAIDPSPRWLATTLILAVYVTVRELDTSRGVWPLGLVAGALATLRMELVPVAVAVVIGAAVVHRTGLGLRRIAVLVVVPLAVVLPYVIVWLSAKGSIEATAYAVVAPSRPLVVPLVAFVAIVGVGAGLARLVRDPAARWITIATLAGCAGIASQLAGPRPYAATFLWPILVGGGLALGVEALRARAASSARPPALALVISLLACVLIYDGRDVPGRVRWVRRYAELVANIEYLRHAPLERAPDRYASLLAQVPAGATVAVWVTRPETLDYARHRFVDLRVPRIARLRQHRWDPRGSRLASLLAGIHADYLLVEDDHRRIERGQRDLLYRFACPPGGTERACADELEAIVLGHRVVATAPGARLVDLAR